jgi:three-Cys-motif partner protein
VKIPGSPLIALEIQPAFREYHFIDLDSEKTAELRRLTKGRTGVYVHEGDCNQILLNEVLPRVRFEDRRRGLCLLDPYGLHLNWEVIAASGMARTIDLVLNFPVADMNRNALWRDPTKVSDGSKARMTAFWGEESWTQVAYTTRRGIFEELPEKEDNETVANAFRKRLKDIAGFAYVTKPLPMRNSRGATVYYLFGASQKEVATKIITDIFRKYGQRGDR